MKRPKLFCLFLWVLIIAMVMATGVQAAAVGRLVRVEGRVDVLKGGKLPATPAKVRDSLEPGDIVRTKSNSRAQIQFVDDTTLTIAPQSRVAVEEYLFDAKKGQRRAVLQVFMGMVKTVVKRLYQLEEPDFILKTHTAVMGVRGTEWVAQLLPNNTDVYAIKTVSLYMIDKPQPRETLLELKNVYPEIPGVVNLKGGKFSRVGFNLTPTLPVKFDLEDLKAIDKNFKFETAAADEDKDQAAYAGGTEGETAYTYSNDAYLYTASSVPVSQSFSADGSTLTGETFWAWEETSTANEAQDTSGGLFVAPTFTATKTLRSLPSDELSSQPSSEPPAPEPPAPPSPGPTPPPSSSVTYNFASTYSGSFNLISRYPFSSGKFLSWGWGERTGEYLGDWGDSAGMFDTYFYTQDLSGDGVLVTYSGNGNSFLLLPLLYGTALGSFTGSVSGTLGEDLTGTMSFSAQINNWLAYTLSGDVRLEPSGYLYFSYTGSWFNPQTEAVYGTGSGEMVQIPGDYFQQTASGGWMSVSYPPYDQEVVFNADTTESGSPYVTGTREGVEPGPFTASFHLNATSGNVDTFIPDSEFQYGTQLSESGTLAVVTEGVLGEPDADGTRTGAMTVAVNATNSATGETEPGLAAGPVTLYSDGTLVADLWGAPQETGDGGLALTMGQWIQTSDPNKRTFVQRYVGNYSMSPSDNLVNASIEGTGWGFRNDVLAGYYAANMSGDLSRVSGEFTSSTGTVFLMLAGVTDIPGDGPVSGQVFALGRSDGDTLIYPGAPGSISIEPSGQAAFNVNGSWLQQDSVGGYALSFNATPGTFFSQMGTGPVLQTSESPFEVQNSANTEPIPMTSVTGSVENYDAFFNITSTAEEPGAFPASVTDTATYFTRGVVTDTAFPKTAAMSLVSVNSTGGINRFVGPATVYDGASIFADLFGRNPAPGGIPASQTGIWQQGDVPGSFTFSQTYSGSWNFFSAFPFTEAKVLISGWGFREGVYEGYYSATGSHLRFPAPGSIFSYDLVSGVATGNMTGIVTGTLGEPLTGNMTWTGTISTGGSFNYFGPVTIQPDGSLTFNYEGYRTNTDGTSAGTATAGVLQQVPGEYFQQTATGGYGQVSFAPYNNATVFNFVPDGQITPIPGASQELVGTRTDSEGTSDFRASFIVDVQTPEIDNFLNPDNDISYGDVSTEIGEISITSEGVISGDGTLKTGAMTTTATTTYIDPATEQPEVEVSVVAGPVTFFSGIMVGQLFGSQRSEGFLEQVQGLWVQVPDDSGLTTFTQRFFGSGELVPDDILTSASFDGVGWGFGNIVNSGPFAGGFDSFITSENVTFNPSLNLLDLTLAGYVGPEDEAGNRLGNVFATGVVSPGILINPSLTGGAVNFFDDHSVLMSFDNSWVDFYGSGEVSTGINTDLAESFFWQKTTSPATIISNSSAPFNQENLSLSASVPGTGSLMDAFDLEDFSGTNTAVIDNVFPASGSSTATFYTSGVLLPPEGEGSDRVGAMDLTIVRSPAEISLLRGSILENLETSQLSGVLTGRNPVRRATGGPRNIPATQTINWLQRQQVIGATASKVLLRRKK